MKHILVVLDHEENGRLVQECLGQDVQLVVSGTDPPWSAPFDLAIVDSPALERCAAHIQARRQAEQPILLPVLLVAARPDLPGVQQHLGRTADELILTPLDAIELRLRVKTLLQARRVSLARQRAQEAVCQRTAQLEAVRQVDLELATELHLDDLLQSIATRAVQLSGASVGGIYLHDPGQDLLVRRASVGDSPRSMGSTVRRGEGLSGQVWASGRSLRVDDYGHWENRLDTPWASRIGVAMAAPISWGDEILGVLTVSAPSGLRPPFFQSDAELLNMFAAQAAIAIHNARLFDAERTARQRAEKLQAATQALSATLDLQQVFELILTELRQVVPYDSASVQQIRGDRTEIIGGHGFPNLEQLLGESFDLSAPDNPNGIVVRTRAPLILDDARAHYEGFCREPHRQAGIRSWLGVPLLFGDRLIGLITLDKRQPGFYTAEHARLAMAFAAQAAIAIENARLFQAEQVARAQAEAHVAELADRERYLAVLNDITQAALQMPDLTSTLQVLADRLGEVIGADGCYITLWDQEAQKPIPAAAFGPLHHAYHQVRSNPGEPNLTEAVLRLGRPLVVHDLFDTPYISPRLAALSPSRSMLALPLVAGEQKLGAVLIAFEQSHDFSPPEIALCEKITGQIVLVLTKAQLYEETQQRLKELALLFETSAALSTTLDVDSALHTIAWHVTATLNVAGCAISAWDRERDALLLLLDYSPDPESWDPRPAGSLYPLDRYPASRQVLTGHQPLAVQVSDPDAPPSEVGFMVEEGVVSLLMVPLVVGDRAIGLLELMETQEERVFSPTEIRLCQTLANQTAAALDMRRLYDETRRRNRELALLNRVIAASVASQEIEPILDTVCRELALAFDVPRATAALLDADRAGVIVVAEYKTEGQPSVIGQAIPLPDNPFFDYLAQQRAPVVLDNARADARLAVLHDLGYWRSVVSLLVLPLVVEDRVVGGVSMDAPEPHAFTAGDVALAGRVAEQVSGALARIRLAEAQQRLSTAVEQAAEAVVIADTNGVILYANPAFEQNSGYRSAEVTGQLFAILRSDEHDDHFYRRLWHTLATGQVWQGRMVNRKKDGGSYATDTTITPVRNPAGEIVNFIATMRDVTREMELEEQVRQAQKMEAVGRLAGGIAHDFNNLLTIIHLSTRLIERSLRPQDPLWEHVQRIRETGERATRLTKQLLSFSRREIVEPQVLIVNSVVTNLHGMLRRVIGEDIELRTAPAGDLWPIKMDPSQLEQVIVNLVINARDAMPTGGTLGIETANVVLDEVYAAGHLDVQPGQYVLLAISDTGVGMDGTVKAHLFEPFFTTKEKGHGTGLGLATVFGIVKQNGGHVWVYSEVGLGSTFKIYLPSALGPAERPGPPPLAAANSLHGTETILLVEDETDVQALAAHILKAYGYRVLAAGSGPEALRLAAAYAQPIHLLLTDVVMPGMSGKQLAVQLQAGRPDLRVLYTSGYTDNAIVNHGVLAQGTHFLAKPFDLESLARKVRQVLDGTA